MNDSMQDTVYNSAFYEGQMTGSRRSAEIVVPIVLSLIQPKSVIDVGCGMGTWLSVFHALGIRDVTGLDGTYVEVDKLMISRDRFVPTDLAGTIAHEGRYGLVMSLEVAEHLPPAKASQFVAKLVSFGPLILFSAAIPGQGGTHHVNEQWPDYWRALFAGHDYVPVDCLRRRIWNDSRVQVCYRQNMMFYVARDHMAQVPLLQEEQQQDDPRMFSLVHPQLFAERLERPLGLRPLLRRMPAAISSAVKRRMSG